MDPTATYCDMADALRGGEVDLAADLAESLLDWLDRGGPLPLGYSTQDGLTLRDTGRTSCRAICRFVISLRPE